MEYIESTGTQYIDTGFKPNQNTRVVCDFQNTAPIGSWYTLFGVRKSADVNQAQFALWVTDGGLFSFGYGSAVENFGVSSLVNAHQIADLNKNVATVGPASITAPSNSFQSAATLYLCASNDGGTPRYHAKERVYTAQIYNNGTRACDYMACIDPSGSAMLWDDIKAEFPKKYGTFLHGAPIIPGALAGLKAKTVAGGVELSWQPSADANEYGISRDGVQIASIGGDVTSYSDSADSGKHVYNVTPYNGVQAGEGGEIEAEILASAPDNLSAEVTGNYVRLTWNAASNVEGYIVYRGGAIVARTSNTEYTETFTPPSSAVYAVAGYSGETITERSNSVLIENWDGVIRTMITDREAADVIRAKQIRDRLMTGQDITDEELKEYLAGLRGAYNASDINRVGAAVRYVADRLNAEGYGAYVSPKSDWTIEDVVRKSAWVKYIDDMRHLRRKLTLMRTTPQITDGMYSGLKSYAEANAIEQILVDLDIAITCIIRNYIFSGEVFAGEV